jgi:hypothetical protein
MKILIIINVQTFPRGLIYAFKKDKISMEELTSIAQFYVKFVYLLTKMYLLVEW